MAVFGAEEILFVYPDEISDTVTIEVDYENNAKVFLPVFKKQFPEIDSQLDRGKAQVDRATWNEIQKIKGFRDGPAYAPTALIESATS